jgi:ABC-type bacteriocin/lantibiotic exporter with double-glycine peptidase domain
VIERQLSIGQLVAAELIVTAVVASIAKLGGKVEIFYDLVAAVDKLGDIFDLPLERANGESPPPDRGSQGSLVLAEVELETGDGNAPGPVSLEIRPGEWIGLSGASERVTTSLVDAVFGLNAPKSGTIELDGHDVRDLSLANIRSRLTLVRGTEILPGRIADNLQAANPELTADQAWDALRRVGLDQWVKDSALGLETKLLPHGAPLTRSQGLALTIARALAGEPSILILDRTLDRLVPSERIKVLDALSADRDVSVFLVSDEPEVLAHTDRRIDLSEMIKPQGEAA